MGKPSKPRPFRYRMNAYDGTQQSSNPGPSSSEYGSCSESEDSSGDGRAGLQRIDTPPSQEMINDVERSGDGYQSHEQDEIMEHTDDRASVSSHDDNGSGADTESSGEHMPTSDHYSEQVDQRQVLSYDNGADATEDESDHEGDAGEETEDEDEPELESRHYTHEEDQESFKQPDVNDGGSTQSETEEENEDVRNDGGETEDESDVGKVEDVMQDEDSGSIWSRSDPIVAKAAAIIEQKNAEPRQVAYARLVGSGKGGLDYLVQTTTVVIGRMGYDCDLQIKSESKMISRRHAILKWDAKNDQWTIQSISSGNCVVVDGTPVSTYSPPMPLKHNSFLEIGDVCLFFMLPTETIFRINDIRLLEETIRSVRASQNKWDNYGDGSRRRGFSQKGRGKRNVKKSKQELSGKKGSGFSKSKAGSSSRNEGNASKNKKHKEFASKSVRTDGGESTSSDSEPEDQEIPEILDDPKYRLPPKPMGRSKRRHSPSESDTQGRKKRRGRQDSYGSPDDYENYSNGCEDWNKKEKSDFKRALFTVGVDPVYDSGKLIEFDWTRFRKIAELPKKSDDMLEDYYRRLMTDVHALLDEEEREKKMKGPRTKHRKGCDCVICENTRKSRRKRQGEDPSQGDEREKSDAEEPEINRNTAKTSGKLIGLVTAQKLRVRLGIHEASHQVDSAAGEVVMKKLESQKGQPVKDFPEWWEPGYHDCALMMGTAIHGVGQWQDIWNYDDLEAFQEVRTRFGDDVQWPSNQAAMKRLRDVSSLILSELKRDAKRNAKLKRENRRDAKRKARSSGAKPPLPPGHGRRKPGRERADSGDEYEEVTVNENQASDDGGSTVEESGSEAEVDAAQVFTGTMENDNENRYEVEVEGGDMEGDATEDESNDDVPQDSYMAVQSSNPVDQASTEEEEDGDERGHYDSGTESGSE